MNDLTLLLRTFVSAVLLAAAAFKMADIFRHRQSASLIDEIVPRRWRTHIVAGQVLFEASAGVALYVPSIRRSTAAIVAGFFAVALITMAWARRTHVDVGCGCFGSRSGHAITRSSIALSATLMISSVSLTLVNSTVSTAETILMLMLVLVCLLGVYLFARRGSIARVNAHPPADSDTRTRRRLMDEVHNMVTQGRVDQLLEGQVVTVKRRWISSVAYVDALKGDRIARIFLRWFTPSPGWRLLAEVRDALSGEPLMSDGK